MSWKQAEHLGSLLKERRRQKAHSDLLTYCQTVFPAYKAGHHHRFVIGKLQAVEGGKLRRLMVSEPPQHGKTLTVSTLFPCWYLGRDPHRKVVVATYGDDRSAPVRLIPFLVYVSPTVMLQLDNELWQPALHASVCQSHRPGAARWRWPDVGHFD
jgi:hypothetical protein